MWYLTRKLISRVHIGSSKLKTLHKSQPAGFSLRAGFSNKDAREFQDICRELLLALLGQFCIVTYVHWYASILSLANFNNWIFVLHFTLLLWIVSIQVILPWWEFVETQRQRFSDLIFDSQTSEWTLHQVLTRTGLYPLSVFMIFAILEQKCITAAPVKILKITVFWHHFRHAHLFYILSC